MGTQKTTSPVHDDIRHADRSSNKVTDHTENTHSAPDRVQRIQEAAYRRAQERGFGPDAELDDWLAAEREVDQGY